MGKLRSFGFAAILGALVATGGMGMGQNHSTEDFYCDTNGSTTLCALAQDTWERLKDRAPGTKLNLTLTEGPLGLSAQAELRDANGKNRSEEMSITIMDAPKTQSNKIYETFFVKLFERCLKN